MIRPIPFAIVGALLACSIYSTSPVRAQEPVVKKQWPKQGAWQAQLVQPADGSYVCSLNATGSDPHTFGVAFIAISQRFAFTIDDRTEGLRYLPTMTASVDGQRIATYLTVNRPPKTATSPGDSAKVRALIERLSQGGTLKVDAWRVTYAITLDGFPQAAAQFRACRQQAAWLQQGETIGRGN